MGQPTGATQASPSQTTATPSPDCQVLIVGTGALACLFAARLAAASARITMLGSWPEGLRALQADGVRLVEPDGRELAFPVLATSNPADCAGARFALVLVKAWQTERAAHRLAACLNTDGLALTLQNGLGNYETLCEALGAQRAALGMTTYGANLLAPGLVRSAGEGVIALGAHERLEPLEEILRMAGFAVDIVPDATALLWGKLVVNAAINPLTALLRVANGELLERPTARQLLASLAQEASAVAAAQGIALPYRDPVAAVESVAQRTATNHSSMFQDVKRGAPTEIDAISGAIVQAGARLGVSTPTTQAVWLLVKALVEEGRVR